MGRIVSISDLEARRREKERQEETKQFIRACEKLYEQNRARQEEKNCPRLFHALNSP